MPSLFDKMMRPIVNGVTTAMYGYLCNWSPSFTPEITYSHLVHKKNFTYKERMDLLQDNVDYHTEDFFIQFPEDQFPGLYESARNEGGEILEVDGVLYTAQFALKSTHGKVHIIKILPYESI